MRRLILPLFIFFSFISIAQLKELTLKDAVMLQGRSLAPDRITNFQWIPNTSAYSFVSKNWQTLFKSDVKSKEDIELANIADINKASGVEFTGFVGLEWINEHEFFLNNSSVYIRYDLTSKTGTILQKLDDKAENSLFHSASNQIAY
ncbi:MAG: hypothetical protein EBU01_12630, partial [Crocinitomicaceae bacterium]|nr:hypothetical protein [Crocinitomicaceae bacterium]